MSISKASLVLAIVLAGLAGCASTSFVSTWKEPLDGPMEFRGKRVAAIVIHPDAALRRGAENELAKEISKRGAQGVAAYTLYEGEPPQDEAAARKLLQDAGIDGAVVMHPVGPCVFVPRISVLEPSFVGQAGLRQDFQGPVHRGQPN